MIIRGPKVVGHHWIPCLLICPHLELVKPLELVVDTGASKTTVFSEFLGIDCDGLEEGEPVETANGPKTPYLLRDVLVMFRTSKGKLYPVELEYVDVIDLENPAIAGLLGMDVLGRFTVTLTAHYVTLRT